MRRCDDGQLLAMDMRGTNRIFLDFFPQCAVIAARVCKSFTCPLDILCLELAVGEWPIGVPADSAEMMPYGHFQFYDHTGVLLQKN